jgi:UDP-glucuronate decarboxylase
MQARDGRVVSNFIMQALQGEDITIYGDGRQTRSFCFVDDLIDGMIRMMNTPDDFTGPINIGNPREYTIVELAEHIIALTGSRSKLTFQPLPADDPRQRQPDISLARETLASGPKVELREGLEKTIRFFRSQLAGSSSARS